MEMVYVVNSGSGSGSGSGSDSGSGGSAEAGGYRLLRLIPTDGVAGLKDRAVNRIELDSSEALRIVFPAKTEGVARDFFLRLVITSDPVPEVTFAVPEGESFSFEDADGETFSCTTGINIFSFTETDAGLFVVNRKVVSIQQTVIFDPAGGTLSPTAMDFALGAKYGELPVPERTGWNFLGWTTEEGAAVTAADTVKSTVTRLVASWSEAVDEFSPAISHSTMSTFSSSGTLDWTLAEDEERGTVSRSGAISDGQSTSLFATVTGAGRVSFLWKASTELNYDVAHFFVDGTEVASIHGERPWEAFSCDVAGDGKHVLEWRYVKDGSVSKGSDAVWMCDFNWESA